MKTETDWEMEDPNYNLSSTLGKSLNFLEASLLHLLCEINDLHSVCVLCLLYRSNMVLVGKALYWTSQWLRGGEKRIFCSVSLSRFQSLSLTRRCRFHHFCSSSMSGIWISLFCLCTLDYVLIHTCSHQLFYIVSLNHYDINNID